MSGLKVYIPVVPVTRNCAFIHCGVTFLAQRRDKRYCGSVCRSNATERRLHGKVLLGTGVRGGLAVRFYAERRYAKQIKEATA